MKKGILSLAIGTFAIFMNPVQSLAEMEAPERIAVATIFEDAGWQTQIQIFDEIIGPALNMEFVYSDKLSTASDLTDFMTQSIAMGCTGVMNFVTQDDIVAEGAKLAEEKNVYYVTQNSMVNAEVADLSHNMGHVGASVSGMENAYRELISDLIAEDGCKGFFIYTGSAVGGDRGAGAASHFYSVKGMLEAIAQSYDLTYEESVEDLISRKESGCVETGRDDVVIYLSSSASIVQGIEEAEEELKKDCYDTLIAVTSYTSFTNITASAEQRNGKNIMIVATGSDDEMTKAGFETLDRCGDSVLHAAVINPISIANARCALLLANGLVADGTDIKDQDYVMKYEIEPWICQDSETYQTVEEEMRAQVRDLLSAQ